MQDWQRGIELDVLRDLARPFKAQHGPLVFGAFGLTKERDIADAMARGRFTFAREGGAAAAGAIWKRLKNAGHSKDFRGVEFEIPAGDLLVSALAATTLESGRRVLGKLVSGANSAVWITVFQEDATARALVAEAGARKAFTKIGAGSEIFGVYVIGRTPPPAPPPEDLATLSQLHERFASTAELDSMLAELRDFEERRSPWAQHYSSYNKRRSWTAFALRGYDHNDPAFIEKPAEMSKAWKAENPHRLTARSDWTIAADSFPAARAIVARIPGKLDRVRFMQLAPGGELTRHADITDREAGTRDGQICRVHVPLVTSPKVEFQAWNCDGERLVKNFAPGALFYLDQRKPHAVRNPAKAKRIHLVVDVVCTPELRQMLRASA